MATPDYVTLRCPKCGHEGSFCERRLGVDKFEYRFKGFDTTRESVVVEGLDRGQEEAFAELQPKCPSCSKRGDTVVVKPTDTPPARFGSSPINHPASPELLKQLRDREKK